MTTPDPTPGPYRAVPVDRHGMYPYGWRVPHDPAVAHAGHVYRIEADAQARAEVLNQREEARRG